MTTSESRRILIIGGGVGGSAEVAGRTVVYSCDDGRRIAVRFYQTDPPSARFSYKGVEQRARQGVRHSVMSARTDASFWSKGDEAFVEWDDQRTSCERAIRPELWFAAVSQPVDVWKGRGG